MGHARRVRLYEGPARQSGYDGANLNICENLYGQAGGVAAPHHAYHHNNRVVEGETCPTGSSSVAGLQFEFNTAGNYPAEYDNALFFADYSRDCIWAMLKGADGHPAPGQIRTFVAGAANPVNLEMGPDGNLYYVDFDGGRSGGSATSPPTSRPPRWRPPRPGPVRRRSRSPSTAAARVTRIRATS